MPPALLFFGENSPGGNVLKAISFQDKGGETHHLYVVLDSAFLFALHKKLP